MVVGLEEIMVAFQGPYRLAGRREETVFCARDADRPGIYLWCSPSLNEEGWIHYIGETSQSFKIRFMDHLQKQLSGAYSIYDTAELRSGFLVKKWTGYGWKRERGWEDLLKFIDQHTTLSPDLCEYIRFCEIFLAAVEGDSDIRKRVEAALVRYLREQSGQVADLITGIRAKFYPPTDRRFLVSFSCTKRLRGFPSDPLAA
jgi:hypothetical protein